MCKGEEDVVAPAWGGEGQEVGVGAGPEESPEPVYINVEGHFACLLLDDDTPPQAPSKVSERVTLLCCPHVSSDVM